MRYSVTDIGTARMSNCSEELPYTSQLYPELRGDATVIALAVIVVLLLVLTIANYVEELWFFFRVHPHGPNRKYVIFILTLFPVLSLCCVLALFVPRSSLIMEFFASTLRAIGIYVFLKILIGYFGEDGKLLAEMEIPVTFRSPPCCCCCVCMKSSTLNSHKLKISKILCFQLVITRPCTMLILTLLWVDNKYKQTDETGPSNPGTWFQVINAISLLLAMWGVISLLRALEHKLSRNRIRAKFIAVQLAMIFSVAQNAILSLMASRNVIGCVSTRGSMVQANRYHLALLVLETFLLSLLARYAYRFQDPQLPYDDQGKENAELGTSNPSFTDKCSSSPITS